ncbi:hypothetical protein BACCOP_02258 [Phocaeicola coprocola DSM 17136]|uniref:Uncharacterized protein n=1 Tax=Phocaeicola coprocola DSM 17136 TaxID=470145 RepID=B3JK34_9BACT|nr:hypothetical protein BACCOP_02258 [Phocaeicola coprocola DSM 17136]
MHALYPFGSILIQYRPDIAYFFLKNRIFLKLFHFSFFVYSMITHTFVYTETK